MAKRKKSKKSRDMQGVASPMPTTKRMDTGIEQAENGYIIRVSGEGLEKGQGYTSKSFVAMDHPSAIRIASQGLSAMAKKVAGKKKGGKKAASRKRV